MLINPWYLIRRYLDYLPDAPFDEPTPNRRRRPRRRASTNNVSPRKVLGASVVTLAVVALIFLAPANDDTDLTAATTSPSVATKPNWTTAQANPAAEAASKPAPGVAMDNRGFVNSKARCEGVQSAVAVGRTKRSLVVICRSPNGAYDYKGVRVSDGAVLTSTDVRVTSGGFEALTDAVTYRVSATELVATSNGAVLTRDPMVEYRRPH